MSPITAVEINAYAIIIVAIICMATVKRPGRSRTRRVLYLYMAANLIALLVADIATRVFDGVPGARGWNWAANLALFLLAPGLSALWVLYTDYQVCHDRKRLKKLMVPLVIPLALNALFALSSLQTGWYFTIDAGNLYRRGPLLFLHVIFCFAYLIYASVFILVNRKRLAGRHLTTLLAFPLPAVLGWIFQSLFYGLAVIWSSDALSMLLIYLSIQDNRLDTDFLTGVFNRRLLDRHIRERMQQGAFRKPFSAILLDLDHFKEINDTLGHTAGDRALTDTVALIKACLRRNDFIARYGGDEFFILLDIASQEVLEETVRRLRECFRQFNDRHERPYALSFSAGYDVCNSDDMEPEAFMRHVDALMYAQKRAAAESAQ